ncbi:MAG: sulfotransferase family protein [Chthoniobacterales bacterium]
MKRNRVIIVIGVHRSGTSAITKGLETMGASLGHALIAPNIFNEKGYWEDSDFHKLNLEMLDFFDDRLRRILPLTEEETMLLCQKGYFEQASELLCKKSKQYPLFGIKDPRFSLLLPFWKKVLQEREVEVSFVIALRNPLNVAACQEQFKNQHREKSLWIWISYLLSCLEHSQGEKRHIVDYDELLKNPKYQMERLAKTFELPLDPNVLQSYSCDFIDSSLRHFHGSKENTPHHSFCHTFALEIYEKLLAVATDRISFEDLQPSFKKWKEQFFSLESLLVLEEQNNHRVHNLMKTNQELHQTNTEQLKTIIELNKTVMEKFKLAADLSQIIEQRDHQIAEMKKRN